MDVLTRARQFILNNKAQDGTYFSNKNEPSTVQLVEALERELELTYAVVCGADALVDYCAEEYSPGGKLCTLVQAIERDLDALQKECPKFISRSNICKQKPRGIETS